MRVWNEVPLVGEGTTYLVNDLYAVARLNYYNTSLTNGSSAVSFPLVSRRLNAPFSKTNYSSWLRERSLNISSWNFMDVHINNTLIYPFTNLPYNVYKYMNSAKATYQRLISLSRPMNFRYLSASLTEWYYFQ